MKEIAEDVPTRGRRQPFTRVPTSLRLACAAFGVHLVEGLMAVVLDTCLVGVHPLSGGVIEGPVEQASGLPAVLDLVILDDLVWKLSLLWHTEEFRSVCVP